MAATPTGLAHTRRPPPPGSTEQSAIRPAGLQLPGSPRHSLRPQPPAPNSSPAHTPTSTASAALLQQHHQRLSAGSTSAGPESRTTPGGQPGAHFKGHQRRQSVARLLPDISKLRLLSWLVEASSELINCDIAIMDGVYAKLNRSQESLLFWNATTPSKNYHQPSQTVSKDQKPAVPSVQPVANKIVISQRKNKSSSIGNTQQHQRAQKLKSQAAARNHHSLPLPNYDASSLASSSLMAPYYESMNPNRSSRSSHADCNSILSLGRQQSNAGVAQSAAFGAAASEAGDLKQQLLNCDIAAGATDSLNAEQAQVSEEEEDDDDNSSATSSTTSSGIHGGTSLSSNSSHSSSGSSTSGSSSGSFSAAERQQSAAAHETPALSSAEQLSEKIRRTVMEHNYLQSLLVNIIRQHDRQRDLINQRRRRQMSADGRLVHQHQEQHLQHQHNFAHTQQRIDLADIADALDDGCLCLCHSRPRDLERSRSLADDGNHTHKASTLPTPAVRGRKNKQQKTNNANSAQQQAAPARKDRRLKQKLRSANNNEINKEDLINLLSDKLCENCFKTHYWLHGGSMELYNLQTSLCGGSNNNKQDSSLLNFSSSSTMSTNAPFTSISASSSSASQQDLNCIIAKRNATFIKLVQQEVRSTISKSIELIDLIRKEIKSPESIKQKQLMRCFSTSIQLLTSVGNYVVPAQDISSFIPEVLGPQQATLFSLPSSDFDHLLLYPSNAISSNTPFSHHNQVQPASNYHLAAAPEIPIRRRSGIHLQQVNQSLHRLAISNGSIINDNLSPSVIEQTSVSTGTGESSDTISNSGKAEQLLSPNQQQQTKINDNSIPGSTLAGDSSSGASSNNSSASSSIARGVAQQSSLTRAQTSSAILDGKTSHDLSSFEDIASLTRHHTDDDSIFNLGGNRQQKFWQSSKFNFIKKLLHVKQQRLLRQQSKDRRIYNNKVQNKFRLVMMDLTHFNKSQQLLTTENGVNSLLTSMRNVLEFGLYLTLKLY